VYGQASVGVGGYFTAGAAGTALQAVGAVRFNSSGVGTIQSGTKSRKVTPGVDITASSKVLVTLMGNPGGSIVLHRVARDAANDQFTVYLTANATANTPFAWFVIS
jgi:hypothetical protein